MSLETDVVATLETQCPRVFPSTAPVNTARPFVTWEHVGGDPLRYIDGTAAVQRHAMLQLTIVADTKAEALALSLAVESALCAAAAYTAVPQAALQGRHDDDMNLYLAFQEFAVLGTR